MKNIESKIQDALLDEGFDAMQYPLLVKKLVDLFSNESEPLVEALEKKYSCQNCGHTANLTNEALTSHRAKYGSKPTDSKRGD